MKAKLPLRLTLADADGNVLESWVFGDGSDDDMLPGEDAKGGRVINGICEGIIGGDVAHAVNRAVGEG